MGSGDPSQAFLVGVRYYAWVDYDSRSGNLEVSVSANASKPSAPSVVGRVDVAGILQSQTAYVAFTGGTSNYWQWPNEHHYIYSLGFQATSPSQVSNRALTIPNSCTWNATSVRCPGFAGTQGLLRVVDAHPGQGPDFPLDLEYWSERGCAYVPTPQSLALNATAKAAFEVAFSFSFLVDRFQPGGRGFTFVLNQNTAACGDST